jgi:hypothetical protein
MGEGSARDGIGTAGALLNLPAIRSSAKFTGSGADFILRRSDGRFDESEDTLASHLIPSSAIVSSATLMT